MLSGKSCFRIFAFILVLFSLIANAQKEPVKTYFELSNYMATPKYDETVKFCRKLDSLSPQISYTNFGISQQGRELPLLIADKNGNFDPETVRKSGKLVVLIQACIHAGECEGKDAGLMFFRDIVYSQKISNLLEHCTVLFIPVYNTDGHERFGPFNRINQNGPVEMGWRTTARSQNLNRDYLKADAVETQNWLKLFSTWLPDFFMDIHTTDGADYQYTLTYGLEMYGNTDSTLSSWMKMKYLPELTRKLSAKKYDLIPYIMFRNWHDPRSGLNCGVSSPMLSTGYNAIQNRPGILIETHMLKPYKDRVFGSYEMILSTLEILNKDYQSLILLNKMADDYVASEDFRKKSFPLKFRNDDQFTEIDFKGFEYDTVRSSISGGLWFRYSHIPVTYKIRFYNHVLPYVSTYLPEAYIIPPEWTDVISRLDYHAVKYSRISKPVTLEIKTYRFNNVQWRKKSYESHLPLTYDIEEVETKKTYPAGSVVVRMDQRTARIIAHLLEPAGPDALAYWGFFNSIFEQKEYGESYVLEKIALEMLEKNPDLKKEFENKKATEPEFANDPDAILNWFYSKSPYWDQNINLYPIGKIYDKELLLSF